jgi:hypothetical protein
MWRVDVQRGLAHQVVLEVADRGADLLVGELAGGGSDLAARGGGLGVDQRLLDLGGDLLLLLLARELLLAVQRLLEGRAEAVAHGLEARVVAGGRREGRLRPAGEAAQLVHRVADLLDHLVAELDGPDDDLLRQLVGAALDHRDGVARAGHHHVERRGGQLVHGGERDVLVARHPDAQPAQRAEERHGGERQRGAGADDREDVGVVLLVVGQHERLHLHVGLEALGPQRTDRAIRHAHGQDLLLRRRALTLEEAAGDLARGVGLLAVVEREGEEVDPLARGRDRGAREHDRLAVRHHHRAGSQSRHPTRLDRERLAAHVDRHHMLRQVAS